MSRPRRLTRAALSALLLLLPAACDLAPTPPPATPTRVATRTPTGVAVSPLRPPLVVGTGNLDLQAAGSTLSLPLYRLWFESYSSTVDRQVRFTYRPISSAAATREIIEGRVLFAGSDVPLSDEQARANPGIIHLPLGSIAMVPAYNLPVLNRPLVLDGPTLAAIFAGELTVWNSPKIAALNPDLALPNLPISVFHRTPGSGATAVFTAYLSSVSPTWRANIGQGPDVSWPLGEAADTTANMAQAISARPGAIGYIDLSGAVQMELTHARLINKSGNVVEASLQSIETAAGAAGTIPPDLRLSLINATDPDAWPITAFNYILINREAPPNTSPAQTRVLAAFLWWATHQGQPTTTDLLYARLSPALTTQVEAQLRAAFGPLP